MARRKKTQSSETEMDLMPMIDIIFQLLIFFLLSAKFIAFEGQLQAFLPKDRGLEATTQTMDLASINLFLVWNKGEQKVECLTTGYRDPNTGAQAQEHQFADDPGCGVDAEGRPVTSTSIGDSSPGSVTYDYHAPDFKVIEEYMGYRKDDYARVAPGKSLPVNVTFEDGVPWQMVVNVLDICDRLGITDFSLTAKEVDY